MLVEIISFFLSPFISIFGPYINRVTDSITSPKTQRTAVKSIFITGAAIILVSIAFTAYLGFYMIYIPKIAHVKPIYLQYQKESSPYAIVDFTENNRYDSFLTADQAYDVSVDLDVPSSDRNVELGNFMIGVELKARNETVQSSSRPCILTYQSHLFRIVYTFWRLIPLVLGFTKEDQRLKVTMLENMIESTEKPITQALITISNGHLEVYSAQIRLDAHFQGLRYFMYYHPVPTAITFMTMFLFWEILFSVAAWRSFISWWQNKVISPEKPLESDTYNVTDGNLRDDDSDKTWLDGRRDDAEGNLDDDRTTAESESEYEPSRPGSIISPTETVLVSESGETESIITDDDETNSIISQPLYGDESSVRSETDDDPIYEDDQTEGSATPTTQSRRSTLSEISTSRSEFEDRPTGTSTSRLHSGGGSTSAYSRRTGSNGGNDE